jgi:hypothetical protein
MATRCTFANTINGVVAMIVLLIVIGISIVVRNMIGKVCFVDIELVGE